MIPSTSDSTGIDGFIIVTEATLPTAAAALASGVRLGARFFATDSGVVRQLTLVNNTAQYGAGTTDTSGAPGAANANTPSGRAAIAIGASSVVITNPLVTAASHVFAVVNQAAADATLLRVERVHPVNGSFTIYGTANATAAVVVDWFIAQ